MCLYTTRVTPPCSVVMWLPCSVLSALNSTTGDTVTPVTRIVDLVTVDLSRYVDALILPAALTACRSRLVRVTCRVRLCGFALA